MQRTVPLHPSIPSICFIVSDDGINYFYIIICHKIYQYFMGIWSLKACLRKTWKNGQIDKLLCRNFLILGFFFLCMGCRNNKKNCEMLPCLRENWLSFRLSLQGDQNCVQAWSQGTHTSIWTLWTNTDYIKMIPVSFLIRLAKLPTFTSWNQGDHSPHQSGRFVKLHAVH